MIRTNIQISTPITSCVLLESYWLRYWLMLCASHELANHRRGMLVYQLKVPYVHNTGVSRGKMFQESTILWYLRVLITILVMWDGISVWNNDFQVNFIVSMSENVLLRECFGACLDTNVWLLCHERVTFICWPIHGSELTESESKRSQAHRAGAGLVASTLEGSGIMPRDFIMFKL